MIRFDVRICFRWVGKNHQLLVVFVSWFCFLASWFQGFDPLGPRPTLPFAVLVAFLLGAEDGIRKDLHGFTSAAFGQGVKKGQQNFGHVMDYKPSSFSRLLFILRPNHVYKQPKGPTVWKGWRFYNNNTSKILHDPNGLYTPPKN